MGHLTDDMTRLVGEIKDGHPERVTFLKGMGQEVAAMREGFRRANEERVREVKALRQEVDADLAGARRAWFGPSPAERRAREQAERERRAQEQEEVERRAQEEAARLRAAAAKEAKGTEPKPKGPATKKGPTKKK